MTEFEKWWNNYRTPNPFDTRWEKRAAKSAAKSALNVALEEFISNISWTHEWDKLYELAESFKHEPTTVENEETERDHSEVEG